MTKRRHLKSSCGCGTLALAVLAVCALITLPGQDLDTYVCPVLSLLITIALFVFWQHLKTGRTRIPAIWEIDSLSGTEFEEVIAALLRHQGYSVEATGGSSDLGVDLIAQRGRTRIAIQCKRVRGKVSRHAVSDAVGGKAHYGCDSAMVVTSGEFTKGAIMLAQSNACVLIDRETVAQWMSKYKRGRTGRM